MDGLNSRMGGERKKNSNFETRLIEITQSEQHREKRLNKIKVQGYMGLEQKI